MRDEGMMINNAIRFNLRIVMRSIQIISSKGTNSDKISTSSSRLHHLKAIRSKGNEKSRTPTRFADLS